MVFFRFFLYLRKVRDYREAVASALIELQKYSTLRN
jgi:hypothetical protein